MSKALNSNIPYKSVLLCMTTNAYYDKDDKKSSKRGVLNIHLLCKLTIYCHRIMIFHLTLTDDR